MGTADGRHRLSGRLTVVKYVAALVSVVIVGVGLSLGTAAAAEPCAGSCAAGNLMARSDESSGPSEPSGPVTVTTTVTESPDPATVTETETTEVTADPTTVTRTQTQTQTVVITPDPSTITRLVTVPNSTLTIATTVPKVVTETATTTVARSGAGDQSGEGAGQGGGVATSTQYVGLTNLTTETGFQKVFLTDQVTNTVTVTRYNAASINPQTGMTPAVTVGTSTVSPGGTVTLSGSGFTPKEKVTLTLHSSPALLATVQADSQGEFSTTVRIPADTTLGKHTIHVVGVSCKVETIVPLTVVAPSEATQAAGSSDLWSPSQARLLSYTGVDVGSAEAVATMLIGSGVALMVIARRRLRAGRHRA